MVVIGRECEEEEIEPSETEELSPHSNFEMVKVDAANGAMEAPSDPPPPPLITLAQRGDLPGLSKYLSTQVEGDVFEELFGRRDKLGRTALHWAADGASHPTALDCCRLLIEKVSTGKRMELINSVDAQSRSALVWAAARGNSTLLQYLLQSGADPCLKDKAGKNVLHFVAELAHNTTSAALDCATVILSCNVLSLDDKLLHSVLDQKEAHTDRTPLHLATIAGNEKLIELLIKSGANVLETDSNEYSVLHHAVINALPHAALSCSRALLQLIQDPTKTTLLNSKEVYGRAPLHIAARRGNHSVLKSLIDNGANYLLQEDQTGHTALHLAASLGNESKAAACVATLLRDLSNEESSFFVNIQNSEKLTAMYLAARHRNVEACKHLLRAGSAFDKKSSHGKTPLEKVYKRIPEAVSVLLEKSVEQSGYANRFGAIDSYVEIDFGPILGSPTTTLNKYKEIEELAKIQYARWEQRRDVLAHPFIRVFLWKKWEKIAWVFSVARFFHMFWFLSIFVFLVMVYRVHCPYKSSKSVKFSWTALRPAEEEEGNGTLKTLSECTFTPLHLTWGLLNLLGLLVFLYGLLLQTQNRVHWFYKPLRRKPMLERTTLDKMGIVAVLHYLKAFFSIVPVLSLILSGMVVLITIPVFGLFPMGDEAQYSVVGLMGFLVWFGVYLEVGKIPICRVYINLLWKASSTLGFAILIHLPILFGFAAVFVLLMQRMPSFSSASQAIVKVLTLMIGELDYESLFYGEEDKTDNILFAGIEMVALAIFVVFVAVLLLNFLIGLAADEIKDFRERAKVWHLCTQIEQISLLESFLDQRCFKGWFRKGLMLMPPRKGGAGKERRRLEVYIPTLPKELQRAVHNLNLRTLEEEK